LKADGRGEGTEGLQRVDKITAGLQEGAEAGEEPAAGGQEGDQFDGSEANAFEEVQKVQQCSVGFVRR
jgi:hypothetical protein